MKKLILFVIVFLCLSMVSCNKEPVGNSEPFNTSSIDDPVNENDSEPNENTNQGGNHTVPYSVSFSSITEMKDFLNSAKGNTTQYEEFVQKNNINASITQNYAQHIAKNVEQNDIPFVKSNLVADEFAATYYLERNELDMIYQINRIRYRFVYKYNKTSITVRTTSPVLENVNLGTYVFDLYQGDGCFVGELVTDSAVIQVVVYAEQTSDVALDVFNMEILQSSDKTPIKDPLPSQSIEISGWKNSTK